MSSLKQAWTRGGLLFGKMWEDARVEMELAQHIADRNGVCRVLSVASSGDTSFALASVRGVDLQSTDINPAQICLCELKQVILRELGPQAVKDLLYKDVRPTFDQLRSQISAPCLKFWDAHISLLKDGFHRAGRVDRMMSFWLWLFSKLVVSRADIDALLACHEPCLQRELVESQWQGRKWQWGIRFAFWKPFLRAVYGRDLADRLPANFAQEMSRRLLRFLTDFQANSNPYLWQTFAQAELGPEQAPYLKAWGPVEFFQGTVEEQVERRSHDYDYFVLSNILEVADSAQQSSLLKAIRRAAQPGALVCLRFMAPRPPIWPELEYLEEESLEAGQKDRALFCNHVQLYRLA